MKKQARLQPQSLFSYKAFVDAGRLAFAGLWLDFCWTTTAGVLSERSSVDSWRLLQQASIFFNFFFYENDSEYKFRWVLRKRGCSCSGARFRTLNKILENVGLAAKALDV
jgi:hypothetical protein